MRTLQIPFAIAPLLLAVLPVSLHADGGVVRLSQLAGPFGVTIFSAPAPVRVGLADISVLVQRRDSHAIVLDADVALRLVAQADPSLTIATAATHQAATNKLLYAASVDFPMSGAWRLAAIVQDSTGVAEVVTEVMVEAPAPPLATYWPYFSVPPLAIVLFGLHQWLAARRRGSPAEAPSFRQARG